MVKWLIKKKKKKKKKEIFHISRARIDYGLENRLSLSPFSIPNTKVESSSGMFLLKKKKKKLLTFK